MTRVRFWGGLDVIGSSKISVVHEGYRVLLDMGLDIPDEHDLFRPPVTERPGRELADRLRLGLAPRIPGLWDPAQLPPTELEGDLGRRAEHTAVFCSHAHIDHVGLAGFVREDVPVYAHQDTVRIMGALARSGQGLPGGDPAWRPLCGGQVIEHGPFRVECVPVDHDLPGASGYLVTTPEGTLAFTGDLRFHGRHPERSQAFVERVRGVDVLITEGTLMSFDPPRGPVRGEDAVLGDFERGLGAGGLVLLSVYPRDVERVEEFTAAAARHGREILWPARTAAFLTSMGRPARSLAEAIAEVVLAPDRFVVQPDSRALPDLLDLPLRPGTPLLHANGEPLGEFDPRWPPFADWVAALGLDLRRIGSSGHATADALFAMVERVHPKVLFPIHTTAPTRFLVPRGIRRVIAEYGKEYDLTGQTR